MSKRTNKYAGIKQLADGTYFARAYVNRSEYSRSFSTQAAAIDWRSRLVADLKSAPSHISYENGQWVGWLETQSGERFKIASAELRTAIAEFEKAKLQIGLGLWVDPEHKKLTLGDFIDEFREIKKHRSGKTWAGYNSLIRSHFGPLMDKSLVALSGKEIRAWLKAMEKRGVGAVARRQAYRLLHNILGVAVTEDKIDVNPANGVTFSNRRTKKIVPLEAEQVREIAKNGGKHGDMIWFTGMCGLRWGEVTALQVKHVNLMRARLNVEVAWSTDESGKRVLGPPKTGVSRSFKLPNEVIPLIQKRLAEKSPDDLIFEGRNGQPIGYSDFRKSFWKPAVQAAGLPNATFHELRHTCASQLIRIGAPILVVSEIMGHASPKMTLDVYGHLYEGQADKWMDNLGQHLVGEFRAPTEQERNPKQATSRKSA